MAIDTYVTHFQVHTIIDDARGVDNAVVAEVQGV